MSTTPQSGVGRDPLPAARPPKPTFEEFQAAVRQLHRAIMEAEPNWDPDAEMEAEHRAILNGADL